MKKNFITIFILLAFILSACGSATNSPGPQRTQGNGELPAVTKLVLGTLKLEGTENAVTPEQAGELLPLWQVYLSLLDSDTAAQQEINVLVDQINSTMTPEQNKAIEDFQLSQEDMLSIMQEQGISMENRPQGENGNPPADGNRDFPGGGQGFSPPEGGMPPGGEGMPGGNGGQGPSEEQIATMQAAREAGGGGFGMGMGGVPTPLIQAVIEYLQKKAAS